MHRRKWPTLTPIMVLLILLTFAIDAKSEATDIYGPHKVYIGSKGNQIKVPMRNNVNSAGPVEGVKLIVHESPRFIAGSPAVAPISVPTVNAGGTADFHISFDIEDNVSPGSTGTLKFHWDTANKVLDYPGLKAKPWNAEVRLVAADLFSVSATPPYQRINKGETKPLTVFIKNHYTGLVDFSIRVSHSGSNGWSVAPTSHRVVLPGGAPLQWPIVVSNNGAIGFMEIIVYVEALDWGVKKTAGILNIVGNPGHNNDHPDDSYSVSDPSYPSEWLYDSDSDIGVLASGFGEGLHYMAGGFDVATTVVKDSLAILNEPGKSLDELSMLMIGSTGLVGLDSSPSFRESLADYVAGGGTLVVFTAQNGYEWQALPGGELTGYGWTEDMSCLYGSVYIDTYHQMLSGQDTSTLSLHVDGYFTDWPDDATILLRRTKNGMPAMLMYPYGEGLVVALTAYTDWGYGHGQWSEDGRTLVRDIIAWASDPKELPEFSPGEDANLSFEVMNESGTDASQIRCRVLDPDRELFSEETIPQSVLVGEPATVAYDIPAVSRRLGIWYVYCSLLDEFGELIQDERLAERFVVSDPGVAQQTKEITFDVTSDAEYYAYGSDGVFNVRLWNHGDADRQITFHYWFPHNYRVTGNASLYGAYGGKDGIQETVEVLAGGESAFPIQVPVYSYDRLKVWFYDESDAYLGFASRGFSTYTPEVTVGAGTDKEIYLPGEEVVLTIGLQNRLNYTCKAPAHILVLDPNNTRIFEETISVELLAGASATRTITCALSQSAPGGAYVAQVHVSSNGSKIGSDSTYFQVPEPRVAISPILPGVLNKGVNPISFRLESVGPLQAFSGDLEVTLKYPNGSLAWTETKPFKVLNGKTATVAYEMSVGQILFGDYGLAYKAVYHGKETGGEKELACAAVLAVGLDRASYRIGESVGLDINISNSGRFALTDAAMSILVPDIGYEHNETLNLSSNQNISLPVSMMVPQAASAGAHTGTVTLWQGSSVSEAFTFFIPVSKLVLGLDETSYEDGAVIAVGLENVGGIDTRAQYSARLRDTRGVEVIAVSGELETKVLEPQQIVCLIPENILTGQYHLYVSATDTATGDLVGLSKILDITGLLVDLNVHTDKKLYATDEPKTAIGEIDVSGGIIENGRLNLKVFHGAGADSESYSFVEEWGSSGFGDGQFSEPYGIAVDSSGNVYVSDENLNGCRIQKFDSEGTFLLKWGEYGHDDGQFDQPRGIAVDLSGNVYVADADNARIQKFDSDGSLISVWGGYRGEGDGQFEFPSGVAVDLDGNVLVADTRNDRIQKFDSEGNFISKWGYHGSEDGQFSEPRGIAVDAWGNVLVADSGNRRIQKFDAVGNFVAKWGSSGSGDGQLDYPHAIAVDSSGNVYVADTQNDRVQKFDSRGNFITKWGSYGWASGEFDEPCGIAVNPSGDVFVADTDNERIQKFQIEGEAAADGSSYSFVATLGSQGFDDGQFNYPMKIAVDSWGSAFVADTYNDRIQKFNLSGTFLGWWGKDSSGGTGWHEPESGLRGAGGSGDGQFYGPQGIAVAPSGNVYVTDANRIQKFDSEGNFLTKWGSGFEGSGDGQFRYPYDIAVDSSGNVFVADTGNSRIQKFDSDGNFLAKWGSEGSGDGQFMSPTGIAVDSSGNVFVADGSNHRIQKFDSDGNFLAKWDSEGSGDGQFYYPVGAAVDSSGNVFVADTGNYRIQKFDCDGNFLAKWGSEGSGDGQFMSPTGIAVDSSGIVLVADVGNNRIQKFRSEGGGAVWEADLTVDVAGSEIVSTVVEPLEGTGKFVLVGDLYSSLSQFLGTARYSFFVDDNVVRLTFDYDKVVYKTGETATVSGEVINSADVLAEGLNLVFTGGGSTLYTETFDLSPDGVHPFSFDVAGLGESLDLSATVHGLTIPDEIEVEPPSLDATITCPGVVGRDPFDLLVTLTNPMRVDADVTVDIAGESQNVIVPAGQSLILEKTLSIVEDTTVDVILSGDVSETLQKAITFGEKVEVAISPEEVYPEGVVGIPYSIQNAGSLDVLFDLEIALNGDAATETIFVPVGEAVTGRVDYDLAPGDYNLTFSSFFGEGNVSVRVARLNQLEMSLSLGFYSRARALILQDDGTNGDVEGILTDAGMDVTTLPVSEYESDGSDPGLDDFDVVVLGDGAQPSSVKDMPILGKTALLDFVSSGGGLIVTESTSDSDLTDLFFADPYKQNDREKVKRPRRRKSRVAISMKGGRPGDAVKMEQCGEGRIVKFAVAGNRYGKSLALDRSAKLLLANAAKLAAGDTEMGVAAEVSVSNVGYNDFAGQLSLSSEFCADVKDLVLSIGETKNFTYDFDLSLIEPGTYDVVASALYAGNVVRQVMEQLEVPAAEFELTSKPVNPAYVPDQEASMTFGIENVGKGEGQAEVHLSLLDLLEETRTIWIDPGMEAEVTFHFLIPDDLPYGEYKAEFELDGAIMDIPFEVQGVKIAVSASLDKLFHDIGDTAILTLDITNESDLSPDMYAIVNSDGYEETQDFTLFPTQSLQFNIRIDDSTKEYISFGIYLDSGRSVHLDTIRVRMKGEVITVYTDKGLYSQGDMVTVFVETGDSGTLSVTAPGYVDDLAITGPTSFTFVLPDEMVSGTYDVYYEFNDIAGSCSFDVLGYSAWVPECSADKDIYDPMDEMRISFHIEADDSYPGLLVAWLRDPEGNYTDLFEQTIDLMPGENSIEVAAPLSTASSGTHAVVYALYKLPPELLLVYGEESFDVTAVAVTSLSTDKSTYGQSEAVKATVEAFAFYDCSGELRLLVNGQLTQTEVVAFNGYAAFDLDLGTFDVGDYLLSAQLLVDPDVVSEKQARFEVADVEPPASPIGLLATASGRTATFIWNESTEPDLAGYNVYRDGEKLNAVPLASRLYIDEGMVSGTTHSYFVTASDVHKNESEPSMELLVGPDRMPIVEARMISFEYSTTGLTIEWFGPVGWTHVIEYSPRMFPADWQEVLSIPDALAINHRTMPIPQGDEMGFYRVRCARPNDAQVVSFMRSANEMTIEWFGPAGWTHVIEYSPQLYPPDWREILSLSDALAINQRTVTVPAGDKTGFYRIGCIQ